METTTFISRVLAGTGLYCIFAASPGTSKVQKFYTSVEKMLAAAREMDASGRDVYFGLGTFDDSGSRKAANVVAMRSLYIDLDCGPGKPYADAAEALAALRDFCADVGMPKPIMVNSGYGVHAYWPLEEDVPVENWLPVARALKRTCVAHGLSIDPSVTADAARVLRVPGTTNYKHDTTAPVHILGRLTGSRPLTFYAELLGAKAAPADAGIFANVKMKAVDDPVMQRLTRNRANSFRRILTKSMAGSGCAQITYAAAHQDEVDEPLWRAALSIAKFCTDGEKAAHIISRDHPEYSHDRTEAKLEGIAGPFHCTTFEDIRPEGCEGCPLWGKITSPIQLGAEVAVAETEEVEDEDGEPVVVYASAGAASIPRYPFPFVRGARGGVYIQEDSEDGGTELVPIYMNDLYYTKRVVDVEAGECVIGKLHLPNDEVREFVVPLVAATSKEDLRKVLSKHGVAVGSKKWEAVMAYTQAWINDLQTTTVADMARTQFGWTDDAMTSYVLGEQEIFADRVGYNPPSSKTAFLFPAFRPRGTLEGWKEQAEFYNREGMEAYQFVVCQALAAPLMRLTPVNAAIFDFYSDGSGHGKTTTQRFALSIYGDPEDLIVGPKDTLNARMNRIELMKDVNLQFDEFTEFPAQDTSDLIYGITSGRQKARMSSGSNDERHRGDAWHTTVTASSNYSMLSKVYAVKANPAAEVQRVLRFHAQKIKFDNKAETDDFAKAVGKHTGHAAMVFIQHLLKDMDTAAELLDSVQRKIDDACGLDMTNRFWSVQGAVAVTALILAREAGLLAYDPGKLLAWVVELIKDNLKASVAAKVSVDTLLNDFVNEHYGSILWIKSTEDNRGAANNNGLDALVVPEQQPRVKLVARYETDLKRLFIVLRPFKEWCTKQRLNYDSVMMELSEKYDGKKAKIRLGKGTKMSLPSTTVLQLECGSFDMPEAPDEHLTGG